ncbi:MAG: hypothetical protein E6J91_37575 [Deltaproteobacteria bacterium]|nr:MAG: hypothetical protein E6J91_37575 [Deltaproteobacteria bacterium]
MNCPCDETIWPPLLVIPAGLSDLPRQQFVFAELRRAMLDRAKNQPAFAEWRARAKDDYGVMWLELWAYVGELLSLYDKAISDESYVRTAKLRPSLRRLLESLGYVPRPAVAASVELAVIADGKQPVALPIGTGFRSGAFAGHPPQVFELVAPWTIHPNLNRLPVITPSVTTLTGTLDSLLLSPQTASISVDDVLLIELSTAASDVFVRKATAVERIVDDANRRVVKVTLDRTIDAGTGKPVDGVRVRKAGRTVNLKTPERVGDDPPSWGVSLAFVFGLDKYPLYWTLDGQYRSIHANDRVLLTYNGETRWITVGQRVDTKWTLEPESSTDEITIDIQNTDNDVKVPSLTIAAVQSVFSVIKTLDHLDDANRKASSSSPNWLAGVPSEDIAVGIDLHSCGKVLGPALASVLATDRLKIKGAKLPVNSTASTSRLMLRDHEERGVAVDGGVDLANARLTIDAGESWSPGLAVPGEAFGNIVTAVRGETVRGEILGSGDATVEHQAFKLAKKPLTYVTAAGADNAAGVASTLTVWVDGLQWTEAQSFFGHGPGAQIYVVRQDDEGASTVTFGDGVRGARLPTGSGNVVASYRFGAGAASPPAGSITQIAKPVAGLAKVISPVASGGGADAEGADSIRTLAPRSALLLGRAISIEDFEVAALTTPGVITAHADWSWENVRQRPVVKVWVVGGAGVAGTVAERLVAISEPDTPIDCEEATAVSATLTIDLELDPARVATAVLASVQDALLGNDGWLLPANLGIDQPLLRSPLLAFLLSITGVIGVRGIHWNGSPLIGYGVAPGVGSYFDLATTTTVTGS